MNLNSTPAQKGPKAPRWKGMVKLWRRLIEPSASIRDEEQRRQSRILSAIVLIILPILIIVGAVVIPMIENAPTLWQSDTFLPTLLFITVSILVYGLNRSGRYRIASGIYILVFIFSPWWAVVRNFSILILPFAFLMVGGVLMTNLLLPGTLTLVTSVILTVAGVLLMPLMVSEVEFTNITSTLTVVVMINIIILVFSFYRNKSEHERQAELRNTNIDLRESVDYSDKRLGQLIETIIGLGTLDFSARAEVGENGDIFDALATGLNALGEELGSTTTSTAFLDDILSSISNSLIVVDADENIQLVNHAVTEMLGYTGEELVGQPVKKIFSTEKNRANTENGIGNMENISVETEYRGKDGRAIPVLHSGSVLRGTSKLKQGVIWVGRDISSQVRARQLLEALNNASLAIENVQEPDVIFALIGNEFQKMDFSCSIFLVDTNEKMLDAKYLSYDSKLIRVAEKLTGLDMNSFQIPYEDVDLYRRVIESKQAIYDEDTVEVARQTLPKPLKRFAPQVVNILNVSKSIYSPLLIEDNIYGFLTVQSSDLIPDDAPAIMAFANQITAVWQKVSFLKELEKNLEEKELAEIELIEYRDHLEELVAIRTQELEAVNTELSNFAYVTSHDLKAPLRAISQLSSWIVEDYSEVLDEEGQKKLSMLIERTKYMHNLIEGILQYSRVSRMAEKDMRVDLNATVREVIDLLDPPKTIHITIDDKLPVVTGEQTRIAQVFQNLLSNAIRYIDKPEGHITIKCKSEKNEWIFSITDNGQGIEAKYFDKIFGMFQTLSTRKDVDSTGIGLALVKRIVEKWDGDIWVESKMGHGSTFFFTMPKSGVKHER